MRVLVNETAVVNVRGWHFALNPYLWLGVLVAWVSGTVVVAATNSFLLGWVLMMVAGWVLGRLSVDAALEFWATRLVADGKFEFWDGVE